MLYDWIKALHVISLIAWMAGMLYLPRLFVYHCEAPRGSVQSETFKVMERRLLKAIINPAMAVAWLAGLWLAWQGFGFRGGWLHAKLALVLLVIGYHHACGSLLKKFERGVNTRSHKWFRVFNEVPVLLLIAIVILVVVKPF